MPRLQDGRYSGSRTPQKFKSLLTSENGQTNCSAVREWWDHRIILQGRHDLGEVTLYLISPSMRLSRVKKMLDAAGSM